MGGIPALQGVHAHSKRNVVLHVVELPAFLRRRCAAFRLGWRFAAWFAPPFRRTRASARPEHLHPVADDLGRVALVAVLVLVFPRANAALDVDLRALLQIFARDFGEPAEERDAVPLGRFLHLAARLVFP